jgi:uncharacterized RDD family membrane protein YckC
MIKKSLSLKERECLVSTAALEPAPYGARFLAFLMDFILVFVGAAFLLNVFIFPEYFPGVQEQIMEQLMQYGKLVQEAQSQGLPIPKFDFDRTIQEAMGTAFFWIFIVYVFYHSLLEQFCNGASLGKKMFRLQVVSLISAEPLGFFESFVRASVKAVALMTFVPFFWVSYTLVFFNPRRQAGHDLLMRSVVVLELDPPAALASKKNDDDLVEEED